MALVAPPVAAMEAVQESEKKRRRAGTRKRNAPYPLWFYLPAAIIYGVLFILPTFSSFYFSLTRWTLFDIEFIGLDNFVQFFEEPMLFQGLVNTFIYGVVTSAAKVVLGLLIAVLLTSSIFGRGYLRVVIFFPVLVSVIGVGFTFSRPHGAERIHQPDARARRDRRPELADRPVARADVRDDRRRLEGRGTRDTHLHGGNRFHPARIL